MTLDPMGTRFSVITAASVLPATVFRVRGKSVTAGVYQKYLIASDKSSSDSVNSPFRSSTTLNCSNAFFIVQNILASAQEQRDVASG